jgi:hypothetical protein
MRALLTMALVALAPGAWAEDKKAEPATPEAPQTRQLRVLQQVMPVYQQFAPEGGCVAVQFVIQHDGFVGDVKVLEARPPSLAEPTVAALKQWQFQSFPPPDVQTQQTFNFAPEQVRMPDSYVRSPLAAVGEDGTIGNQGCSPRTVRPPVSAGKPEGKNG